MAQENQCRGDIIDGPSKWDLMVSLLEGNPYNRHEVKFRTGLAFPLFRSGPGEINVAITSIEQEDGSGESWNFKGRTFGNRKVTGYYSTKFRTGKFDLEI